MELTALNYYSQEINKEYLSVSQYKSFIGSLGRNGCEYKALEELYGRWRSKKSTAMMVGQFVDSYFEGSLSCFKRENPDMFLSLIHI